MHAAILDRPDAPPRYGTHPEPVATADHELVVDVLAAGLHHLTRAVATGTHYTAAHDGAAHPGAAHPGAAHDGAAAGEHRPRVPGVDGVVRDPDGRVRYVVLDDPRLGTFAERTVIDVRRSVVLPDDVDPVLAAAAMNPGQASWLALRRRAPLAPGAAVLVLGATGGSGRLAVQVARLLGAGRVVAAGRDERRLAALRDLGADDARTLDRLDGAGDVDVVLDFLWGAPAVAALTALLTARTDRARPLTWVQVGSMAGATAELPAALLRAARVEVVGSGFGSVPPRDIVAELPELAAAVARGDLQVQARPVPLADVERTWSERTDDRIVYVP